MTGSYLGDCKDQEREMLCALEETKERVWKTHRVGLRQVTVTEVMVKTLGFSLNQVLAGRLTKGRYLCYETSSVV